MSLRVWLPLIGTLENKGISNYTPTIASGNSWASTGKIGAGAITLTKQQTILPTSSCMSGAKQMSYCYWVKVNTAWETQWLDGIRWISTDGSATHTSRQEFYTNCTLIGTWYSGGSISGKSFTPGVWTHLAATFDYNTGKVIFYINGTQVGTTSNLSTTHYCRGDFYIGDSGVNIDENDVRIYDHCLSAAEVKEIAQGLVLHYKLDSGANLVLNSTTSSTKTLTADGNGYTAFWYLDPIVKQLGWLQTGTRVTVKYDYTAATVSGTSAYCYSQLNGSRLNPIISQTAIRNGSGTVVESFSCTEAQATYASDFAIRFRLYGKATESLTISNVQIYIGDGVGQIIDSSGYGYHGILIGIPTISSNTPRYSASISFNGTTDSVNAGKSFEVEKAQAMTFSCWVYTDNWTGTNQYFISSQESGGFLIRILTDKKIRARVNAFTAEDYSTNGYVDADATISTLNNSEWHLLTGVYDTSSLKLYVDGELKSTKTLTTYGLHFNSSTNLFLAAECAGSIPSNFCACVLSDIRIYYTALSDDAVRQLYEVSAKIDKEQNWHTFECIEDSTTNIEITKTGQTRTVGTLINSEYYDGIDEISAAKVQLKKTNKKINAVEFIEI